jgi:putative endonuclease
MVECSDKSIYTGIAKDVDKRLKQHSKGIGSKYVRARLPITLQWSSEDMDLSQALKMEHQIKSWSKDKKEQWINAYLDGYER